MRAMLPWNHGSPGGWSCNPNQHVMLCYANANAMLGLCVTTTARCLLGVSLSLSISHSGLEKYSCIVHSNDMLTIYYGDDRSLSTIREGFPMLQLEVDHQTSRTEHEPPTA